MLTPLAHIGQVVGRLQSSNSCIAVAHIVTSFVNLCRHEAVRLIIIVVDSVCCGECQTLEDVELQVNVTINHCTLAVVLSTMNDSVWVVLDTVIWVFIIITISIHHLHCRRVVQTYPDWVFLILTKTYTRVVSLREVDIGSHLQPIKNLVVHVSLNCITLRIGICDYTLLIHIVGREVCLSLLVTLRNCYLIVLCNTCLSELIHPVDTTVLATDIVSKRILISTLVINQCLCILLSAHCLRQVISVRYTKCSIECYLCSASLTSLGLYHYNTISTTCTIDSC